LLVDSNELHERDQLERREIRSIAGRVPCEEGVTGNCSVSADIEVGKVWIVALLACDNVTNAFPARKAAS